MFEAETELLERHGHRVERIVLDNRHLPSRPSPRQQLRLATTTVWSSEAARAVAARVRSSGATIVHAHNIFPLFSPGIFQAARRAGAATVYTLHNYRLICPAATLFRDGRICEDCVGLPVAVPGVVHACYRNSRTQTAAVTAMLAAHRRRGTWHRDVDVFVALTEWSQAKLVQGGLPRERFVVNPNFVAHDPGLRVGPGAGFLFAGRLGPGKGVDTILDALRLTDAPLSVTIAGDGPLAGLVQAAASRDPRLQVVGHLDRQALNQRMLGSQALLFPSQAYETLGMSVLEAFAAGSPVIASRLGALPDIVHDGETGLLFEVGQPADLARVMTWAVAHGGEMREIGARARATYESLYTPDAAYQRLMATYRAARASHDARAAAAA